MLVATVLVVAGCGVGTDTPVSATLADLTTDTDRYEGRIVTTQGVVRTFDQPRHYWIEDVDLHRVELVPQEAVAEHLGLEIRVTGRFTFRDDEGRRIVVEELEVIGEPREHASGRPAAVRAVYLTPAG
jgi:hypothetical protein